MTRGSAARPSKVVSVLSPSWVSHRRPSAGRSNGATWRRLGVTGYTARRLLLIVPTVLIVSIIIFVIFHLLPGDAALIQVTEGGTSSISVKQYERALEELGLDRPPVERYADWIWGLLQGDGGNSLVTGQPVFKELAKSLPVTLELAILASIMGIAISIPIGVMSAVKQDGTWDYLGRLFTVFGLALPSFLAGSMLLLVMSVYFKWLPPLEYTPFLEAPMNNLAHVIWPAMILALHETAILVRMTRSSMLEVLRQDYMRTAHAKGLAPRIAVVRHGLRNALLPVVTIAGLQLANLLAGSVIAETIFVLPGVGSQLLNGIRARDWVVVQTIVFLIAAGVLLLNLALDLIYGFPGPENSIPIMMARGTVGCVGRPSWPGTYPWLFGGPVGPPPTTELGHGGSRRRNRWVRSGPSSSSR